MCCMKVFKLILLLLCVFIHACSSPVKMSSDDVAIREVKRMIDSKCFDMKCETADSCLDLKYVIIRKHDLTDYGKIYETYSSQSPSFSPCGMPPFRIIPYKDIYICLIDPYSNKVLSRKEMQALLGELKRDDFFGFDSDTRFLIGVPNKSGKITIVRENTDWSTRLINRSPYIYPEFNAYYWGDLPDSYPKIILSYYSIRVDSSFNVGNSLKNHIKYLYSCNVYSIDGAEMFLKDNQTGNCYSCLVTVNGHDTLKYEAYPDIENKHISFKTKPNPSFFNRLPTANSWEYLDALIRDSTFCIRHRDGKNEYFPVVYHTIGFYIGVSRENDFFDRYIQQFYKKGLNDFVKGIEGLDALSKWYDEGL